MLKREKISEDDKQNTLDKITTFTSMNDGVAVLILLLRRNRKYGYQIEDLSLN